MHNKAFTIMELMIVIILATIGVTLAVPKYNAMTEKAREAEAICNIYAIRDAEVAYKVTHGCYSTDHSLITNMGLKTLDQYNENNGYASTTDYWFYDTVTDGNDLSRIAIAAGRTSKNASPGNIGRSFGCWFYESGKREWYGYSRYAEPQDVNYVD